MRRFLNRFLIIILILEIGFFSLAIFLFCRGSFFESEIDLTILNRKKPEGSKFIIFAVGDIVHAR